jgi:RNA polymerase sigma factor for flagellar operon FliA
MIEKGRHYHECEVGHKLTHTELADKMHMETNEFEDLATEAYIPVIHSINYLARKDEDNDVSVETIKDVKSKQPVEKILRNEFFSKLLGKGFTPQERQIIWLYYYEERSMKDISAMLDLSESMVSQMHYKIMKRLRNKCERNPEYFADIQSLFKV